ncbi:3'-5' exonuclease [Antarcticibacterium flavum]|uniref:3'-5' exonuclease n=1 Tax=Antarcticibacterium flavum TaxID=2058175 RepID=A0A5B7X4T5_9FLAO|nr:MULTISPECIES: 3'-5' exonuclease [Antarcticibacterium]MCM4160179.1 3'-5' exonuclease [Antarcticibacterium sp. W02-3]QCY69728.1 3'-5' exonuclease [Antarcticibacterium flavum]
MLRKINPEHILFLDIETVPQEKHFKNLSSEKQKLWEEKSKYQRKEEFTAEEFYDRAGIWAEFGKIICISVAYLKYRDDKRILRVTTFQGPEEKLLRDFSHLLETHFYKQHHLLCAHNGKEFDFPYIARRILIHNLPLPEKLNMFGRKPWEVPHLDTLELWKFGDYKHYTSLKLLTNVLGIPSPKEDIDGSEVRDVYYIDNQLGRIINYCERDVIAIAQVILKLRQEDLLTEAEIVTV